MLLNFSFSKIVILTLIILGLICNGLGVNSNKSNLFICLLKNILKFASSKW